MSCFSSQGQELRFSQGIIRSNHSLVLQKVSKLSAGDYSCRAINTEGSGASGSVRLKIKCKTFFIIMKGVRVILAY